MRRRKRRSYLSEPNVRNLRPRTQNSRTSSSKMLLSWKTTRDRTNRRLTWNRCKIIKIFTRNWRSWRIWMIPCWLREKVSRKHVRDCKRKSPSSWRKKKPQRLTSRKSSKKLSKSNSNNIKSWTIKSKLWWKRTIAFNWKLQINSNKKSHSSNRNIIWKVDMKKSCKPKWWWTALSAKLKSSIGKKRIRHKQRSLSNTTRLFRSTLSRRMKTAVKSKDSKNWKNNSRSKRLWKKSTSKHWKESKKRTTKSKYSGSN